MLFLSLRNETFHFFVQLVNLNKFHILVITLNFHFKCIFTTKKSIVINMMGVSKFVIQITKVKNVKC